ncbi:MAG: hypothetical protein PHO90_01825 [Candidatus Pacebacteria bacterium]|nr:hypothetical protein [Candidatus Paceibacterota bacterium]
MNAEGIIKLTNAVYKVTDLFPPKDPLKTAIRKEALDVLFFSILALKGFSSKNRGNVFISLKLIEAYFQVSSKQKWVHERNFEVLQIEYDKVRQFFEALSKKNNRPETKKQGITEKALREEKSEIAGRQIEYEKLSDIQLRVLEVLQNKGQLKPNEINGFFPKLSSRSIRRELRELREKHIINSSGSGKAIFYQINPNY